MERKKKNIIIVNECSGTVFGSGTGLLRALSDTNSIRSFGVRALIFSKCPQTCDIEFDVGASRTTT